MEGSQEDVQDAGGLEEIAAEIEDALLAGTVEDIEAADLEDSGAQLTRTVIIEENIPTMKISVVTANTVTE